MQTSPEINDLSMALAKAQGEITGALKDSANPFFKSKYADLASCWDACREPLSKNGLAVIQSPHMDAEGLTLTTMLMHSTGQFIRSELRAIPKDDTPQAMGSCLTYLRRYALTALIGIAQVDDDGNAASGRSTEIKGTAYQAVPVDLARKHALDMMGIITAPAKDGDHDEVQKSLTALDYHKEYLAGNNELYIAAVEQMDASKRNTWKALVNRGKAAEKADTAVNNAGKRQF